MNVPRVVLKARKARPFFGRHPWVFATAIEKVEGTPAPGDVVQVHSFEKEFIAYGLYNEHSHIRVRLYSWDKDRPIDDALLVERLERALAFRQRELGLDKPNGACRLVFSESDGLSGLVVDRYADFVVLQFTSLGLFQREMTIVNALERIARPRAILRRTERAIAELEGLHTRDEAIVGDPPAGSILVEENGLRFEVDLMTGQKTGAFLDQRENRLALARYVRGRSLLDVYCYGGAFGITAAKLGGAANLMGIDSSGAAIALAQRNADLNDVAAEFRLGDAVPTLEQLKSERQRFGVIICDPPKFARTPGAVESALRGYENVNRLAIELLEPGGILCTSSCSGHVSRDQFLGVIVTAAQKVHRELQLLEQRGQAPDHPISLSCLETEYLKCLVLRVME